MTSITSFMKDFSSFLQNNQKSFMNGLLILFTLGGEQIIKASEVFQCPCVSSEAHTYACIFVFGPTAVLIIIGVVVNNLTWRLCHGCWNRSKDCTHGFCKALEHGFVIFARACIVPCAWIFLIFLDGKYYVCMASKAPCDKDSMENQHLKAESQIIGWIFLVSVVGFSSFIIFIVRCMDSVTFMQNRFANTYREIEAEFFETKMKSVAGELAETNVEGFIQSSQVTKKDWDAISKAPEHRIKLNERPGSSSYECPAGPSYTPLHQWYKKKPFSPEIQENTMVNEV